MTDVVGAGLPQRTSTNKPHQWLPIRAVMSVLVYGSSHQPPPPLAVVSADMFISKLLSHRGVEMADDRCRCTHPCIA